MAGSKCITGTPRAQVISVARQFAENAHKTQGRSMIIIGAGMNHWYHSDMNYRGIINTPTMCGCIGKSGGGGSHYVGQENCAWQQPRGLRARLGTAHRGR